MKEHPDNAEALHLLGSIHLMRGEIGAAGMNIRRALERDPTNPVCNCNFATALMEKMETVDAAVLLWAQWAVVFGAVVFALCFHAEYHCCFTL